MVREIWDLCFRLGVTFNQVTRSANGVADFLAKSGVEREVVVVDVLGVS